jgi:L-amino acid N-acyltransferase
MHLRLAAGADAEAIRSIYNAEVSGSTATFDLVPRNPEEQLAWLAEHRGAHPAIVAEVARHTVDGGAENGGIVVGFGSLSPYRDRPAYSTTVESSVYVDRAHRGTGIGRSVLDELIELATQHGFHTLVARIGGGNNASIGLHLASGFEQVGIEREVGRKFNQWLDVWVMQRML